MAVLVTRPHPDNATTAAALRSKGLEVLLAPMLRFEPLAFEDDGARYDGVIATSANALRAIDIHPAKSRWLKAPLFAVGAHTGEVARSLGFGDVIAGSGGAAALPELIAARFGPRATSRREPCRLLHLAGADLAHDLSAEMEALGFAVVLRTAYRMAAVARLPVEACDAFAANQVDAVLHYSRRSARAFVAAVRADGVEISALALPQCCLSDAVAAVMHEAGSGRIVVARAPDEPSMLDAVDRALRRPQR